MCEVRMFGKGRGEGEMKGGKKPVWSGDVWERKRGRWIGWWRSFPRRYKAKFKQEGNKWNAIRSE